ncbi:MAG: peptidylprolyl isomerase [Chitinophagaceae bacterium]
MTALLRSLFLSGNWKQPVFLCLLILLVACSNPEDKNPHIEIQTKFGKIEVELNPDQAPKSVGAFLGNIDAELYQNAFFYRVLNLTNQPSSHSKAELVQGGIWRRNRKRSESLLGIPHESTDQTKILHKNGVISFARLKPGTAKTEFFICIGDQPGFDYGGENNADGQGYAAFGKVVKGMDIVTRISDQPEYEQAFDPPVDIFNIVRK